MDGTRANMARNSLSADHPLHGDVERLPNHFKGFRTIPLLDAIEFGEHFPVRIA
jgi:hypothetical protein